MLNYIKKNKYFLIFYIASIILLIYSSYLIINWYLENSQNTKTQNYTIKISEIKEEKDKYPYITTNINNLIQENKNTIGWIQVPNTNINYPVVQTTDNDYYLTHDFYNKQSSAGWVFLDYRNNLENIDTNTIIYAHNRLDNSMFGTLKNTLNTDWYQNNKYIYFNTTNSMNTYEVFSIYTVNANNFKNSINLTNETETQEYLNDIKNKSIVNFNIDVTANNQIITLYTCANNNFDRTILHAKLVQKKEYK